MKASGRGGVGIDGRKVDAIHAALDRVDDILAGSVGEDYDGTTVPLLAAGDLVL